MEFVDGETLARLLDRQRSAPEAKDTRDFREIAALFAGVAEGLQHAHDKGIVHRDVKPSNLIRDREGRLRILDFGLAHLEGQESLTVSGDVLGTPAYMSPEQARARKRVDHRTDVYSLGATLYEALVLRPPFGGGDSRETLRRILEGEPEEPRKVNSRIPPDLETIVLKCLRKEPSARYATAAALGEDLRRFAGGEPIAARPQARWEKLARRAWRNRVKIGVVGVAAVVVVLLLLGARQLLKRESLSMRNLWSTPPLVGLLGTVSADGRYVSYVDWTAGNLAVLDVDTKTTTLVTTNRLWADTGGWNQDSVMSPDGDRIAYSWCKEGTEFYDLRVSDRAGSKIDILHSDPATPWVKPLDWSRDGEFIVAELGGTASGAGAKCSLILVAADGGSASGFLREWEGDIKVGEARFSPDGRHVAFDLEQESHPGRHDVHIVDLESGTETSAIVHRADDRLLGWAPDGEWMLFSSNRTGPSSLWLIGVRDGKVLEETLRLVQRDFTGEPIGLTRDGSFYFAEIVKEVDVHVAELDAAGTGFLGRPEVATSEFVTTTRWGVWSPDGRSLAYQAGPRLRRFRSANWKLVIHDTESRRERVLSPDFRSEDRLEDRLHGPLWSPDSGSLLVVARARDGVRGAYTVDVESGAISLLFPRDRLRTVAWSPDGESVYFTQGRHEAGTTTLRRLHLSSGEEEEIYTGSISDYPEFSVSHDGRWLAFFSPDSRSAVVLPAGGGEPRRVVQIDEDDTLGRALAWTPDGDLIYCRRGSEIWRLDLESGEARQIGDRIPGLRHVSVHPDGRRISFTSALGGSELWVLENFLPE